MMSVSDSEMVSASATGTKSRSGKSPFYAESRAKEMEVDSERGLTIHELESYTVTTQVLNLTSEVTSFVENDGSLVELLNFEETNGPKKNEGHVYPLIL